VQVHIRGAAQHPARNSLARAQQQEGGETVRGVLLATEDGDLEQVEDRVEVSWSRMKTTAPSYATWSGSPYASEPAEPCFISATYS